MIGFLITLVLFVFWAMLGLALLSLVPTRLHVLQAYLLAPVMGVAVLLVPVFLINRAGVPVGLFALPLAGGLGLAAIVVIAWRRPIFPMRRLVPLILIGLAGLAFIAWPMALYGLDWVSLGNDDMANYTLGAQRFLFHGYFEPIDLDAYRQGREYSNVYWFMHVAGASRSGSELMLAEVWGVTGLNAQQLFMPVIAALNVTLVAATAAMVSGSGGKKYAAPITAILMFVSPLVTLGFLNQLIGQVGGLALLCASFALTTVVPRKANRFSFMVAQVPAALALSGLLIWYPEVLPFFALGWLVNVGAVTRSTRQGALRVAAAALVAGVIVAIVLNNYGFSVAKFLATQTGTGLKSFDRASLLFPFFLLPNGLASLWGFLPISVTAVPEPALSVLISCGFAVTAWLLLRPLASQISKGWPVALMLIPMIGVWLYLFAHNSDFGLFKLSMYLQPFLLAALGVYLAKIPVSRNLSGTIVWVATSILVVPAVLVHLYYTEISTGNSKYGLGELALGSKDQLNTKLRRTLSGILDNSNPILSTEENTFLVKLEALAARGLPIFFPSRPFFVSIANSGADSEQTSGDQIGKQFRKAFRNGNEFYQLAPEMLKNSDITTLTRVGPSNIFNRFAVKNEIQNGVDDIVADDNPSNYLLFVDSALGAHYYLAEGRPIGLYGTEQDPLLSGRYFAGIGRRLILGVVNPSSGSRLQLELTDTVAKQYQSALPPVSVDGVPMGFVGRGSARIFSAPLHFGLINHLAYLSIDAGRDAKTFSDHTAGLMLLYGRDIPGDTRRINAFMRDASMVSAAAYDALVPPSSVSVFPQDLANPSLEYSGIYEDGWISERAFFTLSPQVTSNVLMVRGMIPELNGAAAFNTSLQISLSGKIVADRQLTPGNFEISVPVIGVAGRQRVDLEFKTSQTLPGADGRPIGAKMDFIGFSDK